MPTVSGPIQRLQYEGLTLCVEIGPTTFNTELFWLTFESEDSEEALNMKKSVSYLLFKALANRFSVNIDHSVDSAEINWVSLGGFDISPIGHAVRGDAYTISGSAIPDDVEVVFENDVVITTVTPDVVRPHWVMIAELPASVRSGRCTVQLQAPGFTSDTVPINVVNGPSVLHRVLYPGAPKSDPYTIAIIANPVLELEMRDRYSTDPIMADRDGFFDVVTFALGNLLNVTENLLRQDNLDSHMRFIAVFDNVIFDSNDTNALVRLDPPNLIRPRRASFSNYLDRYSERADVAFAVTGSTTHTRASAVLSSDETSGLGTPYTLDTSSLEHPHFSEEPGVATLSFFDNTAGLTPLHEFGHAASAWPIGAVHDLYVDGGPVSNALFINKKWRGTAGDAVPRVFGTYNGTDYDSDNTRDGLGYPSTWRSYHPKPIDPTRPNLMDNYWHAPGGTYQQCRLDRLTYEWFSDRLRAKVFR